MENIKKQIKDNVKAIIAQGRNKAALELIGQYEAIAPEDIDIYALKASIAIQENQSENALLFLAKGLEKDSNNFDLLFAMGSVNEKLENYSVAYNYYMQAKKWCNEPEFSGKIDDSLNVLKGKVIVKPRLIFFIKSTINSFVDDIVLEMSKEYETRFVKVNDYKQINEGMEWADICWFEWCDELVSYGSKLKLAKEKTLICRLHSYEAFTDYTKNVLWENVDKVIFVAEHIRKFVLENTKSIRKDQTVVIPNGMDLSKYNFRNRTKGFNIAYVGFINYKKGPMLLLHAFRAIHNQDPRFKLYIAGTFQDARYVLYFKQMIKEFKLESSILYQGWQDNLDKWLEDKDYILCTSVLESQNISVMQAMTKGIKPIIHNFVGAKTIYPHKYIWNTIDEAVKNVIEGEYDSKEYRNFIKENYSLEKQLLQIKKNIKEVEVGDDKKSTQHFDYKDYWNHRLNSKFDIEGVGYIGLGRLYNEYLYKNRLDILDYVIKNTFKNCRNLKVLELGPGIGIFTKYFYDLKVISYKAIDIAEKSINELSGKYRKFKFINGDISQADYYNEQYDLIFAADVLLHITNEENYKATIANISKSLKDDGTCILLDPISVLNTKSESPHVIFRDKNYVDNILKANGLELVQIIPVAFFMNYPFDKQLIDKNQDTVISIFNAISYIFSNNELHDKEKKLLCKYLINKERQLLIDKEFGLSEKLLVIRKKVNMKQYKLAKLSDIWGKDELIKEELSILQEKCIFNSRCVNDLKELINKL
ncbi:glycosyltransferase [Sporomusa sp. KB1]|uniref:glycosyltransferase n=1 Tax=Sporomusa sp. KB1 TaxID=943346 RepID=UPI00119EB967|nr:glycosyltransferase [Sporomusa sp. KB1]TWH45232.1 Glycosyltransferase [Sporomusa sp. KB1]